VSQAQERVLALAGIFQGARLAQAFAREGRGDSAAFRASAHSLLKIDAQSTADVFGGLEGVALGLTLLRDKLGGIATDADLEIARYAVAAVQLQSALRRRPEISDAIRTGLTTIESQMEFFQSDEDDTVHPRLVEKLAELYTQTLSTLVPRIMVNGEQGYLANPFVAASVRTALFAAVRAAVLWRQLGGSRLHLLFSRKTIAAEANRLLAQVTER
jgi:high frequency lysogenization protein